MLLNAVGPVFRSVFLSTMYGVFMFASFLPGTFCPEHCPVNGAKPLTYLSQSDGLTVGLPSVAADGDCVFVFHF